MNIKNLLQKAGGLARQHSDKLPKQVRPAVKSAARFLGDQDEKPPSRVRAQQTAPKKKAAKKTAGKNKTAQRKPATT